MMSATSGRRVRQTSRAPAIAFRGFVSRTSTTTMSLASQVLAPWSDCSRTQRTRRHGAGDLSSVGHPAQGLPVWWAGAGAGSASDCPTSAPSAIPPIYFGHIDRGGDGLPPEIAHSRRTCDFGPKHSVHHRHLPGHDAGATAQGRRGLTAQPGRDFERRGGRNQELADRRQPESSPLGCGLGGCSTTRLEGCG